MKLNFTILLLLVILLGISIFDKYNNNKYVNPGSYITIDKNGNKRYFINPKDKTLSEEYYEVDRFTYSEWIKGNDILIRK